MSKPKFDPNQRFEVAQLDQPSEKPKFDPAKPFDPVDTEGPSEGESALRGFEQGATLGFSDEIAGGIEAAGQAFGIKGLGANDFSELGFTRPKILDGEEGSIKQAYRDRRDAQRAESAEAKEANPYSYGAGEVGGAIASSIIPGTAAAKGASLAKAARISAGAGGVAGAGYSEAEDLGGLAKDTATGMAFGAAVPVALHGAGKLVSRPASKAAKWATDKWSSKARGAQSQAAEASAEAGAKAGASIKGGGVEVEQSGQLFDFKTPKNLEELSKWKPTGGQGQLVGKQRLEEIESLVPDLQTKPLGYHKKMMENPKAMKELKLQFENLPTEEAKKIAAYNQGIIDESADKLRQTINEIGGGYEPRPLSDAGDDFISVVKDKYSTEKDVLGPMFEQLKSSGGEISPEESQGLIIGLSENTGLGKLLQQSPETGRFQLMKNAPRSGISDSEHKVLSRVIDDLNDGMTFKELQDTRAFLRKQIDPSNPGATPEVEKVRSLLLQQMEEMAANRGPDVGETFKRYAINERSRESIEKIIGGKIESLDTLYNANPDRVLKKIFANPNHADIVKDYVGEEKFKELAASYIDSNLSGAWDSARGFQASKARNWINKNEAFLKRYAGPEQAERMRALADYGYFGRRFLDEVNPSGTAASLKEMIEPRGFIQKVRQDGITGAVVSETVGRVDAKLKQKQAIKAVNEALGDLPEETRQSIIKTITDQFDAAATKTSSAAGKFNKDVAATTALVGNSESRLIPRKTGEREEQETPVMRPLKGNEKWARDGMEKLKKHNGFKGADAKNPKVKKLLIAASSLKPNSKAMADIVRRIQKIQGDS